MHRWLEPKTASTTFLFDAPGSTDDLERARRRGLVDEDTFYEVQDRLEALHELDPERRWPELFEPLPEDVRSQAIAACWRVQTNAGYSLSHRDAQHITSFVVNDPERFAMFYGPYTEVKDSEDEAPAAHANRGDVLNLRSDVAAAEGQRLLAEATGATSLEGVIPIALNSKSVALQVLSAGTIIYAEEWDQV